MPLERKLKSAINDNRLLILGAQVLFGFQFDGMFQELFNDLPRVSRLLACAGLSLLMLAIGLLITPAMQHRIVEGGQDTSRILVLTTIFGGLALVPLSIALAFDFFIAIGNTVGPQLGLIAGCGFFIIAIASWFALEFVMRSKSQPTTKSDPGKPTPLADKVDQLLTEARVIIPGAQALLGFQLSMTLMQSFQQLSPEAKIIHVIALCCIGLAVILLMTPASLHRISFAGEDDPAFLKVGSIFVIAAPLPLALGIALETYVAAGRAVDTPAAAALAVVAIIALLGLWYVYPIGWRLAFGVPRTQ